jgi:hypothetical protein
MVKEKLPDAFGTPERSPEGANDTPPGIDPDRRA